jgi:hypothetical protein
MKDDIIATKYQMMPRSPGAANLATIEDAERELVVRDSSSKRLVVVLPEAEKEPPEIAFVDLAALFRAE